jgi:hypothetical protein
MATAIMTAENTMTTGEAAAAVGIRDWQLIALLQRGLVAEPKRFGRSRVFTADDLPRLRAAAVRAGYLPPTEATAADGPT